MLRCTTRCFFQICIDHLTFPAWSFCASLEGRAMKSVNSPKPGAWPVLMSAAFYSYDQKDLVSCTSHHLRLSTPAGTVLQVHVGWASPAWLIHAFFFSFFSPQRAVPSTCLSIYSGRGFWSSDRGGDCISNGAALGWPGDDGHRGLYPRAMMIT